jgi:hypothetical protein
LTNASIIGATLNSRKLRVWWNNRSKENFNSYDTIKCDGGLEISSGNFGIYESDRYTLYKNDSAAYVQVTAAEAISGGSIIFYLQRPNGSPAFDVMVNSFVIASYPNCTQTHYKLTAESSLDASDSVIMMCKNKATSNFGVMVDGIELSINDKKSLNIENPTDQTAGVWLSDGNICFNGEGNLDVSTAGKGSVTINNAQSICESIGERKTLYIEPSHMEDNHIELDAQHIRFISAEITNRPYTISDGILTFAENRIPDIQSSGIVPVNTVLYHGADESSLQQYAWQSSNQNGNKGSLLTESDNVSPRTATTACHNVTIEACNKLKDAYNGSDNDNLRIYIVKYREQDKYKHKITNEDTNFDYDYIDGCATDASHIYTADNPTELETELQKIAGDIKEWAGRTPARLCAEL